MYLTTGGKIYATEKMQYNYSKEMFTGRTKRIRITSFRICGLLLMYEDWNFNSGNYLFTNDTK